MIFVWMWVEWFLLSIYLVHEPENLDHTPRAWGKGPPISLYYFSVLPSLSLFGSLSVQDHDRNHHPCAAAAFGPMFGAWLERQCPNPSSCLPPSALNTTSSPLLGLRMVRASDAGTLAFLRSRHPQLSMCDRCRARSLLSSSPRA
jgi:hypothetical protein